MWFISLTVLQFASILLVCVGISRPTASRKSRPNSSNSNSQNSLSWPQDCRSLVQDFNLNDYSSSSIIIIFTGGEDNLIWYLLHINVLPQNKVNIQVVVTLYIALRLFCVDTLLLAFMGVWSTRRGTSKCTESKLQSENEIGESGSMCSLERKWERFFLALRLHRKLAEGCFPLCEFSRSKGMGDETLHSSRGQVCVNKWKIECCSLFPTSIM